MQVASRVAERFKHYDVKDLGNIKNGLATSLTSRKKMWYYFWY